MFARGSRRLNTCLLYMDDLDVEETMNELSVDELKTLHDEFAIPLPKRTSKKRLIDSLLSYGNGVGDSARTSQNRQSAVSPHPNVDCMLTPCRSSAMPYCCPKDTPAAGYCRINRHACHRVGIASPAVRTRDLSTDELKTISKRFNPKHYDALTGHAFYPTSESSALYALRGHPLKHETRETYGSRVPERMIDKYPTGTYVIYPAAHVSSDETTRELMIAHITPEQTARIFPMTIDNNGVSIKMNRKLIRAATVDDALRKLGDYLGFALQPLTPYLRHRTPFYTEFDKHPFVRRRVRQKLVRHRSTRLLTHVTRPRSTSPNTHDRTARRDRRCIRSQ